MKKIIGSLLIASLLMTSIQADCVYGAKDKTSFQVLDGNTLMLTGGYGSNIIIKTYSYFYSSSDVRVLKDSFCSYESAVLYIDGEVVDAQQVTKL